VSILSNAAHGTRGRWDR